MVKKMVSNDLITYLMKPLQFQSVTIIGLGSSHVQEAGFGAGNPCFHALFLQKKYVDTSWSKVKNKYKQSVVAMIVGSHIQPQTSV